MRTTLHNHKFIDTEDKPIIPNGCFKDLLLACQQVIELQHKYSLTPYQKRVVDDMLLGEKSENRHINHPKLFTLP